MVGLPGLGGAATAAVRRPVFAVSAGAGGIGLPAGLLGGDDPWARSLVAITIDAGVAPSVDVAEVWVAADSQAPAVAVDDTLSISLGYEDEGGPVAVFTGAVEAVRRSIAGALRVTASNAGGALSRTRINQSYEQQSAGQIVSDLAGRAGVATGTVEDGIDLPLIVIDDRRNLYAHMAALARRCGYLVRVGADGALAFGPPDAGAALQTFTYGVDVLAFELSERTPSAGAVTAVGEGAAGSEGQDAWNWLVSDAGSVSGSAGTGDPERVFVDRALRSADAARTAAEGIASAAARVQTTGRLLAPGAPAVAVGATVAVAEAADGALNGDWLVLAVRHRFDKRLGFRTVLEVGKAGAGGALGALGGLL